MLLAALGSDLALGIRADAVSRGIALLSLALDVEADIAAAPMDMAQPAPLGLDAVRVAVQVKADAPREALAALVARDTLRSPVANTLHDGTKLNVALATAQGDYSGLRSGLNANPLVPIVHGAESRVRAFMLSRDLL